MSDKPSPPTPGISLAVTPNRIAVGGIVLLVLVTVAAGFQMLGGTSRSGGSPEQIPVDLSPSIRAVSVERLLRDFQADEHSAYAEYGNCVLDIAGDWKAGRVLKYSEQCDAVGDEFWNGPMGYVPFEVEGVGSLIAIFVRRTTDGKPFDPASFPASFTVRYIGGKKVGDLYFVVVTEKETVERQAELARGTGFTAKALASIKGVANLDDVKKSLSGTRADFLEALKVLGAEVSPKRSATPPDEPFEYYSVNAWDGMMTTWKKVFGEPDDFPDGLHVLSSKSEIRFQRWRHVCSDGPITIHGQRRVLPDGSGEQIRVYRACLY